MLLEIIIGFKNLIVIFSKYSDNFFAIPKSVRVCIYIFPLKKWNYVAVFLMVCLGLISNFSLKRERIKFRMSNKTTKYIL